MTTALAPKIVMIDDEPEICWIVKKVLEENGFNVETAFNGERGLDTVKIQKPELVLLDIKLPGIDGLETLQRLKSLEKKILVIMLSAFHDVNAAVKCMKLGAYDYISKPVDVDELLITIKNALKTKRLMSEVDELRDRMAKNDQEKMIWSSPAMEKVIAMIDHIAPYDVTVLIQGESGTGKELIAGHIHARSPRSEKPLISIDCSALPENLVESELFGYDRGAFTGANENKPGRFELAHGGTLFLDEIGNLPMRTQVKLLRVLQERKIQRLGGKEEKVIDVRLITATNTNLLKAIAEGQFREDLYHRLNEFNVVLPPLRNRQGDPLLLANYFLKQFNHQFDKQVTGFSPEVITMIENYGWPGNIRELMNTVKRAVVLTQDQVEKEHVNLDCLQARPQSFPEPERVPVVDLQQIRPLKEICQEVARKVERETIIKVLEETRWNKLRTARLLKINYKTLFNKIKELGI
jgi:DNA-binding NtrC family response regulator